MLAGRAAVAAIAAVAWTACSLAGPNASSRIEPGQDFILKPGESALTRDGAFRVGFDRVTADSRCPKGEQCIRAGDATVLVWFQQGSGAKQMRELRGGAGAAQPVQVAGQALRLVRLEPDQVTGKTIATSDYIATLNLARDAAASER